MASAFDKLAGSLAKRKGVGNPKALAYAIGAKKYGKKGMARKAAAGRRHHRRRRHARH